MLLLLEHKRWADTDMRKICAVQNSPLKVTPALSRFPGSHALLESLQYMRSDMRLLMSSQADTHLLKFIVLCASGVPSVLSYLANGARAEGRPCFTENGCDCEAGLQCYAGFCTGACSEGTTNIAVLRINYARNFTVDTSLNLLPRCVGQRGG